MPISLLNASRRESRSLISVAATRPTTENYVSDYEMKGCGKLRRRNRNMVFLSAQNFYRGAKVPVNKISTCLDADILDVRHSATFAARHLRRKAVGEPRDEEGIT
jgi:hypothetical protein